MATITAERTHEICAGHRVFGHEGQCKRLHGHAYVFKFFCESDDLDAIGRVIDFSVIKDRLCGWLEDNWDHRMLLWEQDPITASIYELDSDAIVRVPFNPTAENMSAYIVEIIGPKQLEGTGVRLVRCTINETSKCSATYSL